MMNKSKTSSTINLDFSEEFDLEDGNLKIECTISAEVFIQKPMFNADSDCDYYGYSEVNLLEFKVTDTWFFDYYLEEYVKIQWEPFIGECNTEYRQGVKNELELLVSKALDKKIENLD